MLIHIKRKLHLMLLRVIFIARWRLSITNKRLLTFLLTYLFTYLDFRYIRTQARGKQVCSLISFIINARDISIGFQSIGRRKRSYTTTINIDEIANEFESVVRNETLLVQQDGVYL